MPENNICTDSCRCSILLVATGFGDPHVFTLDGFEYTFNGLGEYVLLQMPSMDLVVQARTSQAVNGTGDSMFIFACGVGQEIIEMSSQMSVLYL